MIPDLLLHGLLSIALGKLVEKNPEFTQFWLNIIVPSLSYIMSDL